MTLNLGSPWLSRLSLPSLHKFSHTSHSNCNHSTILYLILSTSICETSPFRNRTFSTFSAFKIFKTKASLSESENEVAESFVSELLDDEFINRVSSAKDANEALDMIAEKSKRSGGVVSTSDSCSIISAALDRSNPDLALSIFSAMRSSVDPGTAVGEKGPSAERWKWSRPDVQTYTSLVQGLAASLRVRDALKMIANVCRVGVSPGEEVPFGNIVRCPSCMVAVAVAQPQHGIQIVSCSKCRYQYELVSGNIVSIESEEIRISSCRTQHGCSCMEEVAKIPANNEAKRSCCSSLHCGTDTIWDGTNTQVCYSNS